MEALSPLGNASPQIAPDGVKARVVTTAIGFRIGPFGVDYSSKRVEITPDGQTGSQSGTPGDPSAYDSPQARARFAQTRQADPQAAARSTHPDPGWRRGLDAYAKALELARQDARGPLRASLAMV